MFSYVCYFLLPLFSKYKMFYFFFNFFHIRMYLEAFVLVYMFVYFNPYLVYIEIAKTSYNSEWREYLITYVQ